MQKLVLSFLYIHFLVGHALAKPPIITPENVPFMGEMDSFLIQSMLEDDSLGKDAGINDVYLRSDFKKIVKKYDLKLFGGPTIGNLSDQGGEVWLRTVEPSKVTLLINGKKKGDVLTTDKEDFTGIIKFGGLEPDSNYSYNILVNGEKVFSGGSVPSFKTYPSADKGGKFEVCFGGGARYNHPKEHIWKTIADRNPAAFLWLGDNLYIDDPESRKRQRVYYYRRQLRPEYRFLAARSAQYSIWDDHDFGANDVSGGTKINVPDWKIPVWKVFKENWVNPGYGGGIDNPGCWYSFSIGAVDFFMTDGRYYRDFKGAETMLGKFQKKWLLESLKNSSATFKVIASGTLWTEHADKGGADSWWGVKKEREEIFSTIEENQINGVILISADRHRTDIYRIDRPNGYPIYEFETSKLTNDHTHKTKKEAVFSYNKGNFFGSLGFDLDANDPTMTFRCVTIEGKEVHSMTLKRSSLQR